LLQPLVVLACLVAVEGPHLDLFLATVVVVGGEHGGRRTNEVHKANRKEPGRLCSRSEVHTVEVAQRPEELFSTRLVNRQELRKLRVRPLVGDLDRAPIVAQERHIDESSANLIRQACYCERQSTPLAGATNDKPFRIHERMSNHDFHRSDGVTDEAAVVV